MYISHLTSKIFGTELSLIIDGILLIVLRLASMSSPVLPSPLETPLTSLPFSYVSDAEIPSIFLIRRKVQTLLN